MRAAAVSPQSGSSMSAVRYLPIDFLKQPKHAGKMEEVLRQGTPLRDPEGQIRAVMIDDAIFSEITEKPPAPREGPGTELKSLLGLIGIKASPNCSCNARAQRMDQMGVEWCRQNVTVIVGWLQEEANKRHLPFSKFAARKLVQTAIDRAARKQTQTAPVGA